MRLRNKKTGEHGDYKVISAGYLIRVKDYNSDEAWQYDCLAGFNGDWEDYEPAEPLIKDEKVRKAVRAWAEANGVTSIVVFDSNNGACLKINEMEFAENGGRASISFNTSEKIDTSKAYTIEELCGEEEE